MRQSQLGLPARRLHRPPSSPPPPHGNSPSTQHPPHLRRSRAPLREKAFAKTICQLASENRMHKLQQLAGLLSLRKVPGDYDNRTAMHLAAAHGHVDILELLVHEG